MEQNVSTERFEIGQKVFYPEQHTYATIKSIEGRYASIEYNQFGTIVNVARVPVMALLPIYRRGNA